MTDTIGTSNNFAKAEFTLHVGHSFNDGLSLSKGVARPPNSSKNMKKFPLLSPSKIKTLTEALYYMKMTELKKVCHQFQLPFSGNKEPVILSILSYIKTGTIPKQKKIPPSSIAQKGIDYPLKPKTKNLYCTYINNAKK